MKRIKQGLTALVVLTGAMVLSACAGIHSMQNYNSSSSSSYRNSDGTSSSSSSSFKAYGVIDAGVTVAK